MAVGAAGGALLTRVVKGRAKEATPLMKTKDAIDETRGLTTKIEPIELKQT